MRCEAGIIEHSSLLCLDIDNNLKGEKVNSSPHVQFSFRSPTGTGLKVGIRIRPDPARHGRSFLAAQKYFKEHFGIEIDKACRDCSRLCFISEDPDLFIREDDAEILEPLEPEPEPSPSNGETYSSLPRPCYRVYHSTWNDGTKWRRPGTWLRDRKATKSGDFADTDHWICAALDVLARTAARGDLEHGRLVEFTSSNDLTKRHALPMRLFAGRGDEALGELLSLGLETCRPLQAHVLQYIQGADPAERYTAALSTGWHDENTFVLPNEVIGLEGSSQGVWYQGREQETPYAISGSLDEWQVKIAAFAKGNPNLIGAICAGLAGPLLFQLNAHGGIVHFFGVSSTGKTTALAVGASLWGGGEADGKNKFIRTWQATAVGLEAAAALHSDTLLVVDEIHHVDPRVLDAAVYSLVNGYGKSRGNVHARIRPTARWRVFALSSGEMSSETRLFSGGLIVRGGQAVRMLDVPVEGEYGAFDNLHGFNNGGAFSDALRRNALRHHGHAGPAFVRKLIEETVDLAHLVDEAMKRFSDSENDLQKRAAHTFATMAVAGELATSWGVLPWEAGDALEACATLFRRWQGQIRASASESPDAKILEVVANFIDRFGDARFSNIERMPDEQEPRVMDRAGYWRDESIREIIGGHDLPGTRRIYLFNRSGLREATRGYDFGQVVRALDAAGAFTKKDPAGKTASVVRTPRGMTERLYHVDPEKLRKNEICE
jgi:putative DNA primase/helicase